MVYSSPSISLSSQQSHMQSSFMSEPFVPWDCHKVITFVVCSMRFATLTQLKHGFLQEEPHKRPRKKQPLYVLPSADFLSIICALNVAWHSSKLYYMFPETATTFVVCYMRCATLTQYSMSDFNLCLSYCSRLIVFPDPKSWRTVVRG